MKRTAIAKTCRGLTLVALSCQLFATTAGATAIVAIRTPDAIGIAADSRLTVKGNTVPLADHPECKIGEVGDILFALAGFAADPDRRFDLRLVIRSALVDAGNEPGDPVERVARAAGDALSGELAELREKAPTLYDRFIAGRNGPLAKVMLAFYEDDTPHVVILAFSRIDQDGRDGIGILRRGCPGECNPDKVNALFLADGRQAQQALGTVKIPADKPERAATLMVERLIEMGTAGVGGPVDQVRLDRDGITWIKRNPSCDAEKE